jgi:Protein of unknown function (DUF3810)
LRRPIDAWRVVLVAVAVVAAVVPVSPLLVERGFSNGLYPRIQPILTGLSNQAPFALFDLLVGAAGAWWILCAARDLSGLRQRGRWAAIVPIVSRTAVTAAVAYLAFLLLWGLNYRRPPLTDRVAFDPARVSQAAAAALVEQSVSQLNVLHAPAHASGWPEPGEADGALRDAFARTERALGSAWQARPARPKKTLLDFYFRRAGVAGMTDPYFLETLVATDLLPFERPAVIAHEWSHLAGITDEGEANFVGWVTCMQGAARDRYSAWLFLYDELAGALPTAAMKNLAASLGAGPRADLLAIRARLQRNINPTVAVAGWRVYDSYLKANRVEEGAASYAGVVRLVTGTAFDPDWLPQLRR